MSKLSENLDDTIANAVKAQVQAQVLEALSGNEFFAKHVAAVLNSPVEIPDPKSSYGKIRVPFIESVTAGIIKKATQAAVEQAVEEEREFIQDAVRRAVKRQANEFANNVADELLESAKRGYGFKIQVTVPGRGD